jgi:hypothetical protein
MISALFVLLAIAAALAITHPAPSARVDVLPPVVVDTAGSAASR